MWNYQQQLLLTQYNFRTDITKTTGSPNIVTVGAVVSTTPIVLVNDAELPEASVNVVVSVTLSSVVISTLFDSALVRAVAELSEAVTPAPLNMIQSEKLQFQHMTHLKLWCSRIYNINCSYFI